MQNFIVYQDKVLITKIFKNLDRYAKNDPCHYLYLEYNNLLIDKFRSMTKRHIKIASEWLILAKTMKKEYLKDYTIEHESLNTLRESLIENKIEVK